MVLDVKSPVKDKFIAFTWPRELLVFDWTITFFLFSVIIQFQVELS